MILGPGVFGISGADRVEGCLFGNGERTGNVCGSLAAGADGRWPKKGFVVCDICGTTQLLSSFYTLLTVV